MSWETPLPIFEDEDENALTSKFVELVAAHPTFSPMAITAHIFKDLKDPVARSGQAAFDWMQRLDILERIRLAKLNGNKEALPIETKEGKLRKLEAIYNNEDNALRERLNAIRLHAEIQGEIVKAIDKKITDANTPRRHLHIVQAAYPAA